MAYLSKSLNETERNYEIHNKEMLAIIRELENCKSFTFSLRTPTILNTLNKRTSVSVISIVNIDGLYDDLMRNLV